MENEKEKYILGTDSKPFCKCGCDEVEKVTDGESGRTDVICANCGFVFAFQIIKKNPKIVFDASHFKAGTNLSEALGEWWKDPDRCL